MHEEGLSGPAVEEKLCKGLLEIHLDCLHKWMGDRSYSEGRIKVVSQCARHFQEYLKQEGIRSIDRLGGTGGQQLLSTYQHHLKNEGRDWRFSRARLYVKVLETCGVIATPPDTALRFSETEGYERFLENQRGLSRATIDHHTCWVQKFLYALGCREADCSVPVFGVADVDGFIEKEAARYGRTTQPLIIGVLRCFLRFLYQTEKMEADLSSLVTSPRCYKLESLPHVLDRSAIQNLLRDVDRSTAVGRQHYAILTILAAYGLRAGEVAGLKLEDINWRKQTLRVVQAKTRQELMLPLVPQVGKSIVAYLKRGRPRCSECREIFLLTRAPWRPLSRNNIGYIVNKHLRLAGIDFQRGGAQLFRHSFASHLMRHGVALKKIGDLLGHNHPESTHVYTKTATEQLQKVALEIPEVSDEE